jgi:hypothetical protein
MLPERERKSLWNVRDVGGESGTPPAANTITGRNYLWQAQPVHMFAGLDLEN